MKHVANFLEQVRWQFTPTETLIALQTSTAMSCTALQERRSGSPPQDSQVSLVPCDLTALSRLPPVTQSQSSQTCCRRVQVHDSHLLSSAFCIRKRKHPMSPGERLASYEDELWQTTPTETLISIKTSTAPHWPSLRENCTPLQPARIRVARRK